MGSRTISRIELTFDFSWMKTLKLIAQFGNLEANRLHPSKYLDAFYFWWQSLLWFDFPVVILPAYIGWRRMWLRDFWF